MKQNKTIGEIEKRLGIDLKVRSDMKVSTYLRKIGYKSLARILEDTKEV